MFQIRRLALYCFAGISAISLCALAQRLDRSDVLPPTIVNKGIFAMAKWGTSEGDLVCVVSQGQAKTAEPEALATKTLSVFKEKGHLSARIFVFETPDTLVNMYPLGENDARLLTTWTGGSAYHIRVFSYTGGQVQQVLEASTRGMPEVVIDKNEYEAILIANYEMSNGQWHRGSGSTTAIFRWNGKSYENTGIVPWKMRFKHFS